LNKNDLSKERYKNKFKIESTVYYYDEEQGTGIYATGFRAIRTNG